MARNTTGAPTPEPTPGPTPAPRRSAARSAAEVAADGDTGRRRPRWVGRRLRRERADAIATYRREIADRARTARLALLVQGMHVGPAPYGYGLWERRLVVDPTTANVVRLIFRWRVLDGATPATIAGIVRPYPTLFPRPNGRGGAPVDWSPRVIAGILANPRYTGRQVLRAARRERGYYIPAVLTDRAHTALVDDRLWRLAQPAGRLIPGAITPTPALDAAHTAAGDRDRAAGLWLVPGNRSETP
jgi:hypothetical protein